MEVAIDGVGPVRGQSLGEIAVNDQVSLLVRPERMVMSGAGPGAAAGAIAAEIVRISNVGFVSHYYLRLGNGQEVLFYRLNDSARSDVRSFAVGAQVEVSWEEENGRVFPERPEA